MKMPKIIIFLVLVSVSVFGQNAETIDKLVTYEKWNGAHKAALEWIQNDSKNPEAYLSASKVFIALKNIDSAALFINKGLEVSPESPYLYAGKISIAFLKKENSSVPGLVEKAKDLQNQIKELKVALSDYLSQYVTLSGSTQIELPDGTMRDIIYTARMVTKLN